MCTRAKSNRGRPWTKETFEGFLDELYWLRCAAALVFGLAFGLAPLEGAAGLAAFAALSTACSFLVLKTRYIIDLESFGGLSACLQEGGMPSFGLFMLTWIITHTAVHAADEDEFIYTD